MFCTKYEVKGTDHLPGLICRAIFNCTLSPDDWSNLIASDKGLCSKLSPFIANILSPTCNAPVFSAKPPWKLKVHYYE